MACAGGILVYVVPPIIRGRVLSGTAVAVVAAIAIIAAAIPTLVVIVGGRRSVIEIEVSETSLIARFATHTETIPISDIVAMGKAGVKKADGSFIRLGWVDNDIARELTRLKKELLMAPSRPP